MNNNDQHIDPLQEAIQQRFKGFEFEVDLNVDIILTESSPAQIVQPASFLKYYIGGALVVTSAIVVLLLLNTNKKEQPAISPDPVKKITPARVENIEELPEATTPVEETVELQTSKPAITHENHKVAQPSTIVEKVVVQTDTVHVAKENKEVKTANFDDYIKHKAKQSKDSVELFKHKK